MSVVWLDLAVFGDPEKNARLSYIPMTEPHVLRRRSASHSDMAGRAAVVAVDVVVRTAVLAAAAVVVEAADQGVPEGAARRGYSFVGRPNTADGADWWTLKCLVFVPYSFPKVSCDHHTMDPPIVHTKLAPMCRQCGKRLN